MQRYRLSVISGAGRDDAARPLLVAEDEDAVGRAPLLERARKLKVFELEEDLCPREPRERRALAEGRSPDPPGYPGLRSFNVGKVEHFGANVAREELRTLLPTLDQPRESS